MVHWILSSWGHSTGQGWFQYSLLKRDTESLTSYISPVWDSPEETLLSELMAWKQTLDHVQKMPAFWEDSITHFCNKTSSFAIEIQNASGFTQFAL